MLAVCRATDLSDGGMPCTLVFISGQAQVSFRRGLVLLGCRSAERLRTVAPDYYAAKAFPQR